VEKIQYLLAVVILFSAIIHGCDETSKYQKMLEREMAKEVRNDSLFLGYYLGMPKDDFYSHSWTLNKQKKIMQGPQNMSVEYELKDLSHLATMNFYPQFHDNKIYKMPVSISYKGWAPWNRNLWADSLQQDVIKMLEKWYGKKLILDETLRDDTTYVTIDGNREIKVFIENDQSVNVIFTDLTVEEEVQKDTTVK
jgi:hypothetical protein